MTLSRRALLGAGALAWLRPPAAQDTVAGGPSGRLWDPSRAGRPVQPTTPRETDAEIQAIEKRLRCTCGCNLDVYTCRTTDFTCEVSPAMHREVVALYEAGRTADEIADDFVRRHGVAILMAPPKRGFNLAGYFVPSLAILAAGAVLLIVLRRWTRAGAVAAAAAPGPVDLTAAASPQELERLRQELEHFPG